MNHATVGGRYRTVRLLGTGGMGAVYEAIDSQTGERVAVKLVTAEVARDEVLMSRFEREARAAMAIDTPYIVRTLGAGRDEQTGLPFTVMEYLEGEDGRQLLKRCGVLPPEIALRIVAQTCKGLEKAHEHGVIHRDIKPANLFLCTAPGGERIIKILDFGIAKLRRDPSDTKGGAETAGLTMTGSLLGSPLYMAPEQARGRKDIDFRADLWSLGIVLYQSLCGRTPFQDNDALGDLIIAICTEAPEPVQSLAPWVPPEVAAIIHRALRFDPADRFQTAGEMLAAIMPLLPQGTTITEAMLRPISDAERSVVAPRAAAFEVSVTLARSSQGPQIPAPAQSAQNAIGSETPHSLAAFGSTAGGTVAPQGTAARGSLRTAFISLGAVAALCIGGLAAYALIRSSPEPAEPGAASTTAAAAAPASARHSVKVVIIPATADVEIDGVSTKPKDGVVEIDGPLGSVHHVRVIAGGASVPADVVVTESGALPPKIEATKAAPSATPAAGSTAAPPRGSLGPAGTAKPKTTATPPPADIFTKR